MEDYRFDDFTRKLAFRQSRRGFLTTIGATTGGALGLLGVSRGRAQSAGSVGICHLDDEGVYRYITVSQNAIPTHESHGDIIAPDFLADPANCGGCGVTCQSPANATAICADGTCGFDCEAGFTECGGVCIDIATDPNNCGGCGTVCTDAQMCVQETGCTCASYTWFSETRGCTDHRTTGGLSDCADASPEDIVGAVTDTSTCSWTCANQGDAQCEDDRGCYCNRD